MAAMNHPDQPRELMQAKKYPREYGRLVEQYLRNLSDQGSQK
jgi:hypothetical protein